MAPASHCPCANGTIRSWSPCQTATGAGSAGTGAGDSQPREKPQSLTNARSSSRQPAMPELSAVRRQAATWSANSPVSTALSASITRPPNEEATLSPVMALIMAASRPRNSVSAASSRSAAPNSATFSGPMPPSQSRPSAVYGATPAIDPADRHRPGRAAAQASACGPPPRALVSGPGGQDHAQAADRGRPQRRRVQDEAARGALVQHEGQAVLRAGHQELDNPAVRTGEAAPFGGHGRSAARRDPGRGDQHGDPAFLGHHAVVRAEVVVRPARGGED